MNKAGEISYIRHSLAHALAAAVLKLWPDAKPTIGPAIDTGFYYDFDFNTDRRGQGDGQSQTISEKDLPLIESTMREILKTWKSFEGKEVKKAEALEIYKSNPYKIELINDIADQKSPITLYTSGSFTDLCRGGHTDDLNSLRGNNWKLDRVAGAYWRGDEKNQMLTRIYGLAFDTKDELQKYILEREEAKKRDHKTLGRELDLFTFSELVGAGLPLWTPKGTIVRDVLDDFVWELRKKAGYERVTIPHISKKDLFIKSGHWEKFKDELFTIKTREGHEFALKPMNCPHHTQIFARRQWSYREMPQRYASTTMVYRDEQTGELAGLSRTRAFTQDDAHVFCRSAQIKEEVEKVWNIIETFYAPFEFNLSIRLSLHDPQKMEKYLGTEEIWKKSEDQLRSIIQSKKAAVSEAVGEAAHYGPKIDFLGKDALGRELQVATIQLDMNMPERFDLTCMNEKGEKERIVMIHAAIMGSIERFLSVIIEHYAGAFPLWLSPVQIKILTIGETHQKFAAEVLQKLREKNIRALLDTSAENLGKKVRSAKLEKIPYLLIIGDKEVKENEITVESRSHGNLGALKLTELVKKLNKEMTAKS